MGMLLSKDKSKNPPSSPVVNMSSLNLLVFSFPGICLFEEGDADCTETSGSMAQTGPFGQEK